MTLNQLRKINKHIRIKGITNLAFRKYGKIVTGYDFTEMIKYIEEKTPVPEEGVVCVPSAEALESTEVFKKLTSKYFGWMPIQAGYCNGMNSKLNYLGNHKSNKIIVAITDMIIFIGKLQDILEDQYDIKKVEAYFIPEGVAVEIFSTTLHSLPCKMEIGGFRCGVISIKGTEGLINIEDIEKYMLVSKNTWILAHEEYTELNSRFKVGLMGENLQVYIAKNEK
ncbi:DUF4867 family protein [Clostridium sp. YIM B02515]|uniref:DUF4867 family protein n=1 Tax=Clostridium rhizosphaerae TaxID=2803861 RepID=A0ABS1T5Y9_9CLOT|nr:DUF4867 family protein [Clostridium rhizosphaerae]MBL4934745.1 DUF4867 family protein [Clostridium rhizosphaerae]